MSPPVGVQRRRRYCLPFASSLVRERRASFPLSSFQVLNSSPVLLIVFHLVNNQILVATARFAAQHVVDILPSSAVPTDNVVRLTPQFQRSAHVKVTTFMADFGWTIRHGSATWQRSRYVLLLRVIGCLRNRVVDAAETVRFEYSHGMDSGKFMTTNSAIKVTEFLFKSD